MKKAMLLLLCLCMVLSIFTGCSNSATTTPDEPSTDGSTVDVETVRPTMPEEDKEDMTWQMDVVEGFDAVSLPLCDSLQTISVYKAWQNDYNDDPNNAANMQELERRTNVHVDWTTVSTTAATEQFGMMMASGDWMDIIMGA